jgi:PTH2 family peptidyl-tRNA hydrolase
MLVKQVIVVRTKFPDDKGGTFGMQAGKMAAQVAHAAMIFMLNAMECGRKFTKEEAAWLAGDIRKVCVRVESEEELLAVHKAALEAGLESNLVTDSGLTQFKGVPTKTCLAIGPDDEEKIDKITGRLRLL